VDQALAHQAPQGWLDASMFCSRTWPRATACHPGQAPT